MEKTKSCKKIIETNSRKFILYSKNSNKNLNLILGNIPKIIILLKIIIIEIYGIVVLTALWKYFFYYLMTKIKNGIELYNRF
jgi:hypothetical protein